MNALENELRKVKMEVFLADDDLDAMREKLMQASCALNAEASRRVKELKEKGDRSERELKEKAQREKEKERAQKKDCTVCYERPPNCAVSTVRRAAKQSRREPSCFCERQPGGWDVSRKCFVPAFPSNFFPIEFEFRIQIERAREKTRSCKKHSRSKYITKQQSHRSWQGQRESIKDQLQASKRNETKRGRESGKGEAEGQEGGVRCAK